MLIWETRYSTARPMNSMPRLQCVVQERRDSVKYKNCGRYRQSESHCLFKYTLSGEGVFRNADNEYRLPAGHGFLCEIYDPAVEYYYPEEAKEPWEFLFACFDGPASTAMTKELVKRHGPVFKLDMDSAPISRMLGAKGSGVELREISAGEGASMVFELLSFLDASKNPAGGTPDAATELVRRAKILIEESMPIGMPVGELAAAMEVSREHLARVFARETASTPHEHIARRRVLHACRLLKETSLDVKEIGDLLGIDVPQHFTRLFKKTMKMTPTKFRLHGLVPEF